LPHDYRTVKDKELEDSESDFNVFEFDEENISKN